MGGGRDARNLPFWQPGGRSSLPGSMDDSTERPDEVEATKDEEGGGCQDPCWCHWAKDKQRERTDPRPRSSCQEPQDTISTSKLAFRSRERKTNLELVVLLLGIRGRLQNQAKERDVEIVNVYRRPAAGCSDLPSSSSRASRGPVLSWRDAPEARRRL